MLAGIIREAALYSKAAYSNFYKEGCRAASATRQQHGACHLAPPHAREERGTGESGHAAGQRQQQEGQQHDEGQGQQQQQSPSAQGGNCEQRPELQDVITESSGSSFLGASLRG